MTALLEVRNLTKDFPIGADFLGRPLAHLRAVDDVSFALAPGETLGFVGESGCGKTTVGRLILRLLAPNGGSIHFDGQDITNLTEPEMAERLARRKLKNILDTGARTVVTANAGCLLQIAREARAQGESLQIVHPMDLLDRAYRGVSS